LRDVGAGGKNKSSDGHNGKGSGRTRAVKAKPPLQKKGWEGESSINF